MIAALLRFRIHACVGIFLAGVYLLTAAGHVFTYDGLCRLQLTLSLIERGSIEVASSSIVGDDDQRVLEWQPVYALLGIPPVLVAKLVHRLVPAIPHEGLVSAAFSSLNQWITALTGCLLVGLAEVLGYRRRTGILLALGFGLCSFAWPMSKDTFTAPLVGMLLVAYLVAALGGGPEHGWRRTLVVCALLTVLLFTRRTCAVMTVGLVFLGLLRPADGGRTLSLDRLPWLLLSVAVGLCLILAWNTIRFGDPWTQGATQAARTYFDLDSPLELFSHPIHVGLYGLLVSPLKGLIWYSPLIVLGLFGGRAFARRHPLVALGLVLAVVPRLLLHAAYVGWDGQWCWGPRYVIDTAIALLLPLAEIIERSLARPAERRLLIGVAALGLASQVLAVSVCYHRPFYERSLAGLPVEPPPSTWSPHVAQLRTLWHVLTLPSERVSRLVLGCPADIPDEDRVQVDVKLNRLDFWWVYAPFGGIPSSVVALIVLAIAVPTALAARAIVRELREAS